MTEATYPVPANMAEASAAQRAAAAFYLTRIEALQDVLNGDAAVEFELALSAALVDGVPEGTSAAANIPAAAGWFESIRHGLSGDWAQLNAIANPPSPTPVPEGNDQPQV